MASSSSSFWEAAVSCFKLVQNVLLLLIASSWQQLAGRLFDESNNQQLFFSFSRALPSPASPASSTPASMSSTAIPTESIKTVKLDSKTREMPEDLLWTRNCSNLFPHMIGNCNWEVKDATDNLGLFWNLMTKYYIKEKYWKRNECIFDFLDHRTIHPNKKGVPIGGIGSGMITRSFQGDFTRENITKPGIHHNMDAPVSQFSLRTKRMDSSSSAAAAMVLNTNPEHLKNSSAPTAGWTWWGGEDKAASSSSQSSLPAVFRDATASYHALFPRCWYQYSMPSNQLDMTCRQFSPVIGHNYRETCMPVGLFEWECSNTGDSDLEVSIMFTFQNGNMLPNGWFNREPKFHEQPLHVNTALEDELQRGVCMQSSILVDKDERLAGVKSVTDHINMMISAKKQEGVEVSVCPAFESSSRDACDELWRQFSTDGCVSSTENGGAVSSVGKRRLAAAICIKMTIPAHSTKTASFSMGWDHPHVQLGCSSYLRRYTQFFGHSTTPVEGAQMAQRLCREALEQSDSWNRQIEEWQSKLIDGSDLPAWLKQQCFNDLYYLVDGGTVWTCGKYDPKSGELINSEEHFGYLEGNEYIMVNTYDVHFYASNAVIANWPRLQLTFQRDFARTIDEEDSTKRQWAGTGTYNKRKVKGTMPHDMGCVDEDPFVKNNAYIVQDCNRWKDLNCMFTLTVLRDFKMTGDMDFLRDMFPHVETVLRYHEQFDKDNDGIIENEGFPDNTFDVWTVTGVSAYTGCLYVSANRAASEMARLLGEVAKAEAYEAKVERGAEAYQSKLWNGKYFNFDSSNSNIHDSIQCDMLHGHMVLKLAQQASASQKASQTPGAPADQFEERKLTWLDDDKVLSSMRTIYDTNCVQYSKLLPGGMSLGCVNGMRPNGRIDRTSIYSRESWLGTSATAATAMLQAGLRDEALEVMHGLHRAVWHNMGYWFQVPEAVYPDGRFRANAYMRPLASWAVALQSMLSFKATTTATVSDECGDVEC